MNDDSLNIYLGLFNGHIDWLYERTITFSNSLTNTRSNYLTISKKNPE